MDGADDGPRGLLLSAYLLLYSPPTYVNQPVLLVWTDRWTGSVKEASFSGLSMCSPHLIRRSETTN